MIVKLVNLCDIYFGDIRVPGRSVIGLPLPQFVNDNFYVTSPHFVGYELNHPGLVLRTILYSLHKPFSFRQMSDILDVRN